MVRHSRKGFGRTRGPGREIRPGSAAVCLPCLLALLPKGHHHLSLPPRSLPTGFWQGLRADGQQTGPLQLDQLREMARRKELPWGWPAHRSTDRLWVPLQEAAGGPGRGAVGCAARVGMLWGWRE